MPAFLKFLVYIKQKKSTVRLGCCFLYHLKAIFRTKDYEDYNVKESLNVHATLNMEDILLLWNKKQCEHTCDHRFTQNWDQNTFPIK